MREIIDVLGMLVSADEAGDEVQEWGLYYAAGGPVWTGGSNWPDDVAVASTAEIDEMAERHWLRITGYPSDKGRQFAATAGGRQAWLDHVEAHSPERPIAGPATLEWDRTRMLLRMLYEAYVERGAPRRGVDSLTLIAGVNDPHSARAQLDELVRGGYLESATAQQRVRLVHPTTKTLQMFAGWPSSSAEDTLSTLVAALNTEITETADPDRRPTLQRVRDGLLGAAQEIKLKVIEQKIEGSLRGPKRQRAIGCETAPQRARHGFAGDRLADTDLRRRWASPVDPVWKTRGV
jgi:hypothetical protein